MVILLGYLWLQASPFTRFGALLHAGASLERQKSPFALGKGVRGGSSPTPGSLPSPQLPATPCRKMHKPRIKARTGCSGGKCNKKELSGDATVPSKGTSTFPLQPSLLSVQTSTNTQIQCKNSQTKNKLKKFFKKAFICQS